MGGWIGWRTRRWEGVPIAKSSGGNLTLTLLSRRHHQTEILAEISHPNVVRLGGFFEDKPNRMYWMVLELMEGGELFERIVEKWEDHGGYTEKEARETSGILLHTVAYLHERNIAHRDLKPENLLCKTEDVGDCQLKLADFGFAVKCNGLDQKAMLGTPG